METLQVFDHVLTHAELTILPVGTVIGYISDARHPLTKDTNGVWRTVTGQHADPELADGYLILELPDHPLTLRQLQWGCRDILMAGARSTGVGAEELAAAIRQLDIGDDKFPFGTGMRIQCFTNRDRLPRDSTVYRGRPTSPRTFTMFRHHGDGAWEPLLGGNPVIGRYERTTVDLVGGQHVEQEWLTATPTEDEAEAKARFRSDLWLLGEKARNYHRWCDTFARTMAQVGLSEAVRIENNPEQVGQRLAPLDVLRLPVGTILRWTHHDSPQERVAWFRRVERASNLAGTALIFGYRDDNLPLRGYARTMTVMWMPGVGVDEMALDLDLRHSLPYVPIGTQFVYEGDRYVLCRNHQFEIANRVAHPRREDGPFGLSQFRNPASLRAVSFPGS